MKIPIYITKESDEHHSEDIMALIGQTIDRSVTMLTIGLNDIVGYWTDPDDEQDIILYTTVGNFACPNSVELIMKLNNAIE